MQKWFDYRNRLNEILANGREDFDNIKSEETPTKREEIDEQLAKTEVSQHNQSFNWYRCNYRPIDIIHH
jgi:hypothetical protein